MMIQRTIPILAMGLLALSACGGDADQPVGGVSQQEAAALNDAAAMLDNAALAAPGNDQEVPPE